MRKLRNDELGRIDVAAFRDMPKTPLIIILDDVRSLHNIGSVFRTSDAFLIEKIYLCGITATPPHKDIHKTALGATESVAWEYRADIMGLVSELKERDVSLVAIEQAVDAVPLNAFNVRSGQTYAMIFGNEVKGVSQAVVDACGSVIEIPQYGTKHSLNISVSAGVVIWDFWSKSERLQKPSK
ncbi:RNA methyltransferase [Maribacter sp. 2-571]|uniref:RNA methyltransferase n=1 Tax=Maribacter sp. 2-571 TaxID=3417569 RepID=UPI003D32A0B9